MLENYNFSANIHMYKWGKRNILLDVNSGAIHELDDMACETIQEIISQSGNVKQAIANLGSTYSGKDLEDLQAEIQEEMEAGALFTIDETPIISLLSLNIKAICLNVAHACNMNCHYCFASQGDFGMAPCLMDLETAKQSMDFLIEQSGEVHNLEVDFFGGEPLLVADMLKDLVAYCRMREKECRKRFNFTLTTNAILLEEEVQQWVIENDIALIMSLDGRKETHDRHRILKNGEGTYDRVMPRIKSMVAKKPVSYYVRGTFTRMNLDFSRDLEHMIEEGFDCISIEPAVGPDNGFSIEADDLPQVLQEYERLTDVLLNLYKKKKDIHFFHYNLNLQKGPCLAKRSSGCGAGVEYLVITPTGDIYPCHQFVGEKQFYMGNVKKHDLQGSIRHQFENNRMMDKECRWCWVRNFCGGGCAANAYFSNGDMKKPHAVSCEMHKKRVEGAIFLELEKQINDGC